MDLHELTTAQRKLAQQQLKDIQKGGKKKVQNASDKYSDKYFNANTTNKASLLVVPRISPWQRPMRELRVQEMMQEKHKQTN